MNQKIRLLTLTLALLSASTLTQAEVRHKIAAGETLSTIAAKYKVSVEALREANPTIQKFIFAGMTLIIPTPGEDTADAPAPPRSSNTGQQKFVQQQPVALDLTETREPARRYPAEDDDDPEPRVTEATPIQTVATHPEVTETPVATPRIESPAPRAGSSSFEVAPADPSVRSAVRTNNVTLEYGTIQALQQDMTARFFVDYSQCVIEETGLRLDQYLVSKGEDWCKDWTTESAECHDFFVHVYNYRNKSNTQLSTSEGEFIVLLRPEWIDFGSMGERVDPADFNPKTGGCVMRGTLSLHNPAGELLCQIYIHDVRGMGDYTFQKRLQNMYYELSGKLKKLVKD